MITRSARHVPEIELATGQIVNYYVIYGYDNADRLIALTDLTGNKITITNTAVGLRFDSWSSAREGSVIAAFLCLVTSAPP